MPAAPSEIVDALESVLDIFLSDIRHRERSTFILCDNLVEMACKTKASQHARRNNIQLKARCQFHEALTLPGVRLSQDLKERLQNRRGARNLMQHQSASMAVDVHFCADAIHDIPNLMIKLWGKNALDNLRHWHQIALRIVRLYSSEGDFSKRLEFEDAMRKERWRSDAEDRKARINESIFEVGIRGFWGHIVKRNPAQVEQVLNACQV